MTDFVVAKLYFRVFPIAGVVILFQCVARPVFTFVGNNYDVSLSYDGQPSVLPLKKVALANRSQVALQRLSRRRRRLVPGAGIEPAQCYHRGILSPVRLPVPPSRRYRFYAV